MWRVQPCHLWEDFFSGNGGAGGGSGSGGGSVPGGGSNGGAQPPVWMPSAGGGYYDATGNIQGAIPAEQIGQYGGTVNGVPVAAQQQYEQQQAAYNNQLALERARQTQAQQLASSPVSPYGGANPYYQGAPAGQTPYAAPQMDYYTDAMNLSGVAQQYADRANSLGLSVQGAGWEGVADQWQYYAGLGEYGAGAFGSAPQIGNQVGSEGWNTLVNPTGVGPWLGGGQALAAAAAAASDPYVQLPTPGLTGGVNHTPTHTTQVPGGMSGVTDYGYPTISTTASILSPGVTNGNSTIYDQGSTWGVVPSGPAGPNFTLDATGTTAGYVSSPTAAPAYQPPPPAALPPTPAYMSQPTQPAIQPTSYNYFGSTPGATTYAPYTGMTPIAAMSPWTPYA